MKKFLFLSVLTIILAPFFSVQAQNISSLKIIDENGQSYQMTDGEKFKWDFFVQHTPEAKNINNILITLSQDARDEETLHIRSEIILSGEIKTRKGMSWIDKENRSLLIDRAVFATKSALGIL